VILENVANAGDSELMCESKYSMVWQVNIMLMGISGQAVLGLCGRARHTDSTCCRTTVGCKLNEALATR
jgi:hypothetical protein